MLRIRLGSACYLDRHPIWPGWSCIVALRIRIGLGHCLEQRATKRRLTSSSKKRTGHVFVPLAHVVAASWSLWLFLCSSWIVVPNVVRATVDSRCPFSLLSLDASSSKVALVSLNSILGGQHHVSFLLCLFCLVLFCLPNEATLPYTLRPSNSMFGFVSGMKNLEAVPAPW